MKFNFFGKHKEHQSATGGGLKSRKDRGVCEN
jgi:hypothetical protein